MRGTRRLIRRGSSVLLRPLPNGVAVQDHNRNRGTWKQRRFPPTPSSPTGKGTSVNPKYWFVKPGRHNPGDVAVNGHGQVGKPGIRQARKRVVGKNRSCRASRASASTSRFYPAPASPQARRNLPGTDMELKLMGAGLGREVKISPFHAALVMAAIANDGVMMMPSLAQEIKNGKGETVLQPQDRSRRGAWSPRRSPASWQRCCRPPSARHLPESLP